MPNTMTDTQTTSLFHVLEVPYSTSYAAMDGMGAAYVQTANQPILSAAKDAILSFVAGMETLAFTDLQNWLNKWYLVADQVVNIASGGAGSLQGVNLNFADQRALYKQYVQDLVPYFKYHEILARQAQSSSMQMNVTRV